MTESTAARIAIIGSGGIGGYLAGQLHAAGADVILCARTPFEKLVIIEADGEETEYPVSIETDPSIQKPVDWVFVTTKAQDVDGASAWLKTLVGPNTVTVMIQNGIAHEDRVRPYLPDGAPVLPCIIMCAIERLAPGRILHHGQAQMSVPEGANGQGFADLFAGTRFTVTLEKDFLTVAWLKLLSNAMANPITALTLRRGIVLQQPDVAELSRAVGREVVEVGKAAGAALREDMIDSALQRISAKADSGSSMLYDRLALRPLEHDFITGAVVKAGETHGIDVPVNRTILALLSGSSGHSLSAED